MGFQMINFRVGNKWNFICIGWNWSTMQLMCTEQWYFETGQLRNMKTNKWRKNLSGRRIEMGLCFAKRSLEGWGSEEKKKFFRNSSSFQWSRGKTKHQSQFSWNSNFWGICLFLYCEPALFQYILLPDEADFFSFLLNFKCRQWCFQQVIQLIL